MDNLTNGVLTQVRLRESTQEDIAAAILKLERVIRTHPIKSAKASAKQRMIILRAEFNKKENEAWDKEFGQ